MSAGTSSQELNRPAVGGEYRTRSSKLSPERSTPHVGTGLRSKISNDFSRLARIQSGSPLIFDISSTTSREMPLRARSWPWSSSTTGAGLVMRVLSVAAMSLRGSGFPCYEVGIVTTGNLASRIASDPGWRLRDVRNLQARTGLQEARMARRRITRDAAGKAGER